MDIKSPLKLLSTWAISEVYCVWQAEELFLRGDKAPIKQGRQPLELHPYACVTHPAPFACTVGTDDPESATQAQSHWLLFPGC